jgi:hypothetical protein
MILCLGYPPLLAQQPDDAPAEEQAARLPALFAIGEVTPHAQADAIQKLRIAQFNAAVREMKLANAYFESGAGSAEAVAAAAGRLVSVALALYTRPHDQVKWLERKVELAKHIEHVARRRYEAEVGNSLDLARAEYDRLGAEIELLQAKQKLAATAGAGPRR